MQGFKRRMAQQVLVAGSQVLILALFIVAFPRLAENATSWAADYFVSLAIISPIFMFFGFELQKRTAAGEAADLPTLNAKRLRGIVLATALSLILLPALIWSSFVTSAALFASLVVFRLMSALNEQISANYEALDRFGTSLQSNALKLMVFLGVSLGVAWTVHVEAGIIAGSLSFALVWVTRDRAVLPTLFEPGAALRQTIRREDFASGLGSFLVSLTISAPRLVAAAFLGEAALTMIGVGQSLNRIGQVGAGAMTQTAIALQKQRVHQKSAEIRLTILVQLAIFAVMLACLPLWRWAFPYADGPDFLWVLGLVLLFGLLSQINFVLQSLRLIRLGGGQFLRSPVTFLVIFTLMMIVIWAAGWLSVATLLAAMLASRAVQIGLNLLALRDVA